MAVFFNTIAVSYQPSALSQPQVSVQQAAALSGTSVAGASLPVSVVAVACAIAVRITDLRGSPGVVGRVGRPADRGKWFAAVVIGGAAMGNPMRIPPMQQAAPVGVPAAHGAHPLEEAFLGRLTARRLCPQSPAARDQSDEQCPNPD